MEEEWSPLPFPINLPNGNKDQEVRVKEYEVNRFNLPAILYAVLSDSKNAMFLWMEDAAKEVFKDEKESPPIKYHLIGALLWRVIEYIRSSTP